MNYTVKLKGLTQSFNKPTKTQKFKDNTLFIAFEKAVFGTVTINTKSLKGLEKITIHFGEKINRDGRIDRTPPGTIRYLCMEQTIDHSKEQCRIFIPSDKRNTGSQAIKMPRHIGEVIPFRYVEIENGINIKESDIQQVFIHYPFNDTASSFECSNEVLNKVWDLCKYSIKATTFCGIYVDGDRERIPYEGDAYINQLSHYCVDQEYDFARYSHEYMIQNPTWCTEWHLHSVMMAWTDYLYSGKKTSLEKFYNELSIKTLSALSREDGLISTDEKWKKSNYEKLAPHYQNKIIHDNIRDVVDWPPGSFTKEGGTGERDDHEMLPINTVVNAFHCHTLLLMSNIAKALGMTNDTEKYDQRRQRCLKSIHNKLFDKQNGLYIDGEGSKHSSLHSNMFMLAFNLVPEDKRNRVIEFIKSRGMVCSVYGAQYLLDALYLNDEGQFALELMNAKHDRSWWNMIASGSTMTLEAWDIKYKNNLDWNHAWGAAPANIIPRFLLGIRPLEAGFKKVLIQPQLGNLGFAKGKVPTPHGPIKIGVFNNIDSACKINLTIPENIYAKIILPYNIKLKGVVKLNGTIINTTSAQNHSIIDNLEPGSFTIEY